MAPGTTKDIAEHVRKVMLNHTTDSKRWDNVVIREDDCLIGTYPKSGTTWMQQIVKCLLEVPIDSSLHYLSPYVEQRYFPTELVMGRIEAQQHRRFLKHHLAREYLPESALKRAAHIYVARDGRDVGLSLHNFQGSFSAEMLRLTNSGEFDGLSISSQVPDKVEYFKTWMRENGKPWWSYWEHIRSWWAAKDQPNVLLVHYDALKQDPHGEISRILQFLRKFGDVREGSDKELVEEAVKGSAFDTMRKNADEEYSVFLKQGANSFFNLGTSKKWKGVFPDELVQEYEDTAEKELGKECAFWLATGQYLQSDSSDNDE